MREVKSAVSLCRHGKILALATTAFNLFMVEKKDQLLRYPRHYLESIHHIRYKVAPLSPFLGGERLIDSQNEKNK